MKRTHQAFRLGNDTAFDYCFLATKNIPPESLLFTLIEHAENPTSFRVPIDEPASAIIVNQGPFENMSKDEVETVCALLNYRWKPPKDEAQYPVIMPFSDIIYKAFEYLDLSIQTNTSIDGGTIICRFYFALYARLENSDQKLSLHAVLFNFQHKCVAVSEINPRTLKTIPFHSNHVCETCIEGIKNPSIQCFHQGLPDAEYGAGNVLVCKLRMRVDQSRLITNSEQLPIVFGDEGLPPIKVGTKRGLQKQDVIIKVPSLTIDSKYMTNSVQKQTAFTCQFSDPDDMGEYYQWKNIVIEMINGSEKFLNAQ